MNKHLKLYFNSFKFKKIHLQTFFVDVLSIGIIGAMFFFFGKMIEKRSALLLNGQTVEEMQQYFLSASAEQLQSYLSTLREFALLFFGGIIITVFLSLIIFSFSRRYNWNVLLKKKSKFWRWNSLNLLIVFLSLLYIVIYGIFKLPIIALFSLFNSLYVSTIVGSVLSLLSVTIFLTLLFLTYYHFVEQYKVFRSIGYCFRTIKNKWSNLWPYTLFALITLIVLTLISYPLGVMYQYQAQTLFLINAFVTFIYVSWLRIYLLKVVKT